MLPLYREHLGLGGWFSFNCDKKEWKNGYANELYRIFFNSPLIEKYYGGRTISDELLITNNLSHDALKDSSVLVIGGGPSSESITDEVLESYDYIFSCNHFFKNEYLKDKKIDVFLVGDEVDINSREFVEYIKKHQPVLGFEHSGRRELSTLIELKKWYPTAFIYITRYFSRLGYVPRAAILARLFGASRIDLIGLDGFKTKNHYFENKKSPPPFNDEEKFREQMRIFLSYIINDLKISSDNIHNLSENHDDNIYKGIMKEMNNEKI